MFRLTKKLCIILCIYQISCLLCNNDDKTILVMPIFDEDEIRKPHFLNIIWQISVHCTKCRINYFTTNIMTHHEWRYQKKAFEFCTIIAQKCVSRRQNSKTIVSLCELYHAQSSGSIQNLVSKVTQDGTNWRKKMMRYKCVYSL